MKFSKIYENRFFLTKFSSSKYYITYTKNKAENLTIPTVPCFCNQLEKNRRYRLEKEQQPCQLTFSPILRSPIFPSNSWTKTCLNAFSSLEKILETILTLVKSLKIDFLKITFLPLFTGFQRKTQKINFSTFFRSFQAKITCGNVFLSISILYKQFLRHSELISW